MNSTDSKGFGILTKELASKIDSIINNYQSVSTKLVGIMLDIQDVVPKQYIPREVAAYVSEKMNIPLSRIYDVISFYAALSDVPRADYVIQLCDSVVCKVTDNTTLRDSITKILGIKEGEATADGKYWLEYTPCFGACDISPAIRINGKVYGNLTTEDSVKAVLEQYQ